MPRPAVIQFASPGPVGSKKMNGPTICRSRAVMMLRSAIGIAAGGAIGGRSASNSCADTAQFRPAWSAPEEEATARAGTA